MKYVTYKCGFITNERYYYTINMFTLSVMNRVVYNMEKNYRFDLVAPGT